jgi:hypothetical protein
MHFEDALEAHAGGWGRGQVRVLHAHAEHSAYAHKDQKVICGVCARIALTHHAGHNIDGVKYELGLNGDGSFEHGLRYGTPIDTLHKRSRCSVRCSAHTWRRSRRTLCAATHQLGLGIAKQLSCVRI